MHPAFSVILFTTLSGSGYGLLAWLGACAALGRVPFERGMSLLVFGFALVLVTAGLLASLAHLGQPQRAWRAFSQWRSSWLSREGVLSLFTYAPALALAWFAADGEVSILSRSVGALLLVASLITVICTAMIYASLVPIAAWRDRAVVPGYLGYALAGGALWFGAARMVADGRGSAWLDGVALALLAGVALLKLAYWRRIDALPDASVAAAVGLPADRTVRTFERPNTQSNYLLREMGFVLARRHATRLRQLAVVGLVLPGVLLLASWSMAAGVLSVLAALLFQVGALVERWLFFAQARHTVALYYGLGDAPR